MDRQIRVLEDMACGVDLVVVRLGRDKVIVERFAPSGEGDRAPASIRSIARRLGLSGDGRAAAEDGARDSTAGGRSREPGRIHATPGRIHEPEDREGTDASGRAPARTRRAA